MSGGPLLFLVRESLRNRIFSMLRKLKRPKYLFGMVFGLLYIWWFMIRPIVMFERLGVFDGIAPAEMSVLIQGGVGLSFALLLLLQTFSSETGLVYHENELLFLLAAPVSRAGLLRFKLLQAQPAALLSSLFMGILVFLLPGGGWWAFLGTYLLFSLLGLFRTWWLLALCGLRERGIRIWMGWVGVLGLLLIAGAAFASYEPRARVERSSTWAFGGRQEVERRRSPVEVPADLSLTSERLGPYLFRWIERRPLRYVMLPLRLTGAVAAPGPLRDRAASLGALAVCFGLLTLLIFRTRAEFIQPSLQLAARVTRIKSQGWWAWRREQRQLNQPSGGGPPPPFELSPGGRAWVAIFWKNLICAGTRYTPRMFSRCMLAAIVVGLALGNWPGLDPKVPATLSGVVLYIVVILGLMVSQHVRNDLRLDIPNFIYLRSLPISGFGLLLGEVLGLALILGGMATIGWTFCACAVTQVDGTMLPLLFRVPVFFAGLAMIAALALAWVCVENCLALAYPGWTQLGPLRGGGLDKMGQSMLSALIRMLVLMGALVLPMIVTAVVVALGVMLVGESLVGIGWVALVGALVAGPIIAAEALAAMWFCGKRIYPKFDISVELV